MVIVALLKKKTGMVLTLGVLIGCGVLASYSLVERGQRSVNSAAPSSSQQVSKTITVNEANASTPPASDFFVEYRLERDKLRSERSEVLRDAVKTAQSDDTRQHAQDAILKLVLEKQKEAEMENLIKARGFGDALVFIRDNSVNAVVKANDLSRDDVIQIADMISRISGVKDEDIIISAKP